MSLAETQQIYELLIKIDEILNNIDAKSEKIHRDLPETKEAVMTSQEMLRILFRLNHILAHMGLPQEIRQAIASLQRFVFMCRMAQMSISLMEMGTPYGWIMGGLGVGSTLISMGNVMEGY